MQQPSLFGAPPELNGCNMNVEHQNKLIDQSNGCSDSVFKYRYMMRNKIGLIVRNVVLYSLVSFFFALHCRSNTEHSCQHVHEQTVP